jgi:hypothetical protein
MPPKLSILAVTEQKAGTPVVELAGTLTLVGPSPRSHTSHCSAR